jgi:hypothetical protein
VTPGITSSCGVHRTFRAIATSAAHASASAETNRMNLGATYWLMDAIATLVTHVGFTATLTTSMSGWCVSGGHGVSSPGTHDAPCRHTTSRGRYVDVRPETGERGDAEQEQRRDPALAGATGAGRPTALAPRARARG